jgi:hypothetical protein
MPERTSAATRLVVPLLLVLLAGCSEPDVPTPEPESPAATPEASASSEAAYTDAEQADILAENIDRTYAEDTQYTWYPAFVDLTVEDGTADVTTTLTEADTDLADSMCEDIAAVAFENFIEPIGVADVRISDGGGEDLVDCDVPEL